VQAVFDTFGPRGAQFLNSDRPQLGEHLPDSATINIAHESLIRQWKRLSEWLQEEGRAAHEWRLLKERADRNDLLSWRRLVNALTFRNVSQPAAASSWASLMKAMPFRNVTKSAPAWTWRDLVRAVKFRNISKEWAERYGGGFDSVVWLIKKSALLQFGIAATVLVVVCLLFWLGAYSYQNTQAYKEAKKAAIGSAQSLLDHLKRALPRGDITLNGASNILQVAQDIVTQQQEGLGHTSEYVRLLVNVGCTASDIHGDLGNYTEALKTAKEARDLVEPLRQLRPDDPQVLQLQYITTSRIADAIAERGTDLQTQEEALQQYLVSKALAERLSEKAPKDGSFRRERMFIHQKIGDVYQNEDKLEASIAEYETALSLIQQLVSQDPKWGWRLDLANTIVRLGQVYLAKYDFDKAISRYDEALAIRTELEGEDRSDKIVQSNVATSHRLKAELYAERFKATGSRDDIDAASDEYRLAIQIQERLRDNDQGNATWQASLATLRSGFTGALRNKGELGAALNQSRSAYAIREALLRKDPASQSRQKALAVAAMLYADLLAEQKENLDEAGKEKNRDEAIKLYRSAIAYLDDIKPRDDRRVFESYIRIGDILALRPDGIGELNEYKVANGIALGIAPGKPDSVIWQKNLANSYSKMGDALSGLQNPREAIEQYQKALEIATGLATKFPRNTEWKTLTETLNSKIAKLTSSEP
jgi:tetratricopeptide (TPR) repeat protein